MLFKVLSFIYIFKSYFYIDLRFGFTKTMTAATIDVNQSITNDKTALIRNYTTQPRLSNFLYCISILEKNNKHLKKFFYAFKSGIFI